MLSGIYALYWSEPDLIYIGQTSNLDRRFGEHLRLLNRNKHFNYKVQETFHKYGIPEYQILEYCLISNLNDIEIKYIEEFNAFTAGLNLSKGGDSQQGEDHPNSKYTNDQIIEVFHYLYGRQIPHKEINEITGIHIDVIKAVSCGYAHSWLSEKFPIEYKELLSTIKSPHNSGDKHSGSKYSNEQILEAFELLVDREISLVDISKKLNIGYQVISMIACGAEHKWLQELYPEKYTKMLSNRGKVISDYPLITNGTEVIKVQNAEKFCRERNLQSSNLNKVFKGTRQSHKGWRLYKENNV